ncbi:MAG: hypothetical protein ACRC48_06720 [Aeromonas veronii]
MEQTFTTFKAWVEHVGGPAKASAILKEPERSIFAWVRGERLPRPMQVERMIAAAKNAFDFNAVYRGAIAARQAREARRVLGKEAK